MLRGYIVGSVALHILLVLGIGFWFPGFSPVTEKEEEVLQIFTETSGNGGGDPGIVVVSKERSGLERKKLSPQTVRATSDGCDWKIPNLGRQMSPLSETVQSLLPEKESSNRINSISETSSSLPPLDTLAEESNNDETGVSLRQPNVFARGDEGIVSKNSISDLPKSETPAVKVFYPEPVVPQLARKYNWAGTTLVLVVVESDGKVGEVTVEKSSGYEMLDREAVRTAKKWRFIPAIRDGKPVACQKRIPFTFKLEG